MNKKYKRLILLGLLVIVATGAAFRPSKHAHLQITKQYRNNLKVFQAAIQSYQQTCQSGSLLEIRSAHRSSRIAYKRLEYLLVSVEERYVKDFLNGAPLPVLRYDKRLIRVEEPQGLQVLDEMVQEEDLDRTALLEKMDQLLSAFEQLYQYERNRHFSDRQILEAMRFQLIRIFSLGITGFDTPGSLNGLEEAKAALEGMKLDFYHFGFRQDVRENQAFSQCQTLFQESIDYLKTNAEFDSFDRARFIRDFMNPLYEALLLFHADAGIEIHNSISNQFQPIWYAANSPFSTEFLNPYYFTYLKPDQDNQALQKLGSYLFYEPALSYNNRMSCASCHQPQKAFTDGLPKSLANQGNYPLLRNAPGLINAVYATRHFYDLRADLLEDQIADVVHNPEEFHSSFGDIAAKLQKSSTYRSLFQKAYPDLSMDEQFSQFGISTAMAAYVKNLRSLNSPFDQYMRGEKEKLEASVIEGFNLFMGKAACGTCHFAPLFSGLVPPDFHENESEILGVPADSAGTRLDSDQGRFDNDRWFEEADHYRHSFKTPSVRNIALTGPYMHNGVYQSLEEVMDFYNRGGGEGMGLEVPHQTLSPDSLGLSEKEQQAIIRFMEALTDTSIQKISFKSLPDFDESPLDTIPRTLKH